VPAKKGENLGVNELKIGTPVKKTVGQTATIGNITVGQKKRHKTTNRTHTNTPTPNKKNNKQKISKTREKTKKQNTKNTGCQRLQSGPPSSTMYVPSHNQVLC